MFESVDRIVTALAEAVERLEPSNLQGDEAAGLVEVFARIERLAVAGRTLATSRVVETMAWRDRGHRTAAQFVASQTKSKVSDAIASVQCARDLRALPATRDALASGDLSGAQAAEIVSAASVDRASEASLLEMASTASLAELRERAAIVRAAAAGDEDATERIRRGRYLKHWRDPDGAVRLDARLAPDDGAQFLAAVTARAGRLAATARRSGTQEPLAAHMADALVAVACGEPGPRAVVHVEVDAAALIRGHTEAGETCAIPGVGPISVAAARRLASEGWVKVVERDGVDVTRVTHAGRHIPAHVRSALEARDQTCVVPGCDTRHGLQIDHIVPVEDGGPTRLGNLCRLCRYHHAQKTHHGWRISGRPGAWMWARGGRQQRNSRARAP